MVINLLKSNHSNPQAKLEVLQRRVRLLQSLHELRQTQLQDCFANIEVMNGYSKWIWPFFWLIHDFCLHFTVLQHVQMWIFPTSGCLQDLYGLLDKPADVVWQDDRCKRKQPKQSQSPASVRSFLAKKWLFKNGDVLDRTYARFQTAVQLHSHKWSSKKRNMAKT